MVKAPKFQLWWISTISGRCWFWRLRARNGEIVCQSEGYKTRRAAVNAIYRVIDLCGRLSKSENIIEEIE